MPLPLCSFRQPTRAMALKSPHACLKLNLALHTLVHVPRSSKQPPTRGSSKGGSSMTDGMCLMELCKHKRIQAGRNWPRSCSLIS